MPRSQTASSAPSTPNGTAVITLPGSDHDSYCAARIRNTMTRPNTNTSAEALLDCFSSYACPDHAMP